MRATESAYVSVEALNLILQRLDGLVHGPVFARILKPGAAAVWGVYTLQSEIAATLARHLAIALNLTSLALVACD